jgi:hypothetical protein
MPTAPDNHDAHDYAECIRERFAEPLAGTPGSDGFERVLKLVDRKNGYPAETQAKIKALLQKIEVKFTP